MKKIELHPHKDSYLVYNRKSTDDADNQKNSLSYQRGENIKYSKKEKYQIADMTVPNFCEKGVIDESHSGYKESEDFKINADGSIQYKIDRPKFSKLVGMLRNKEVKGVIFLCWDRASRNKQDDVLLKKLIKQGADIKFSHAQYDKTSSEGRVKTSKPVTHKTIENILKNPFYIGKLRNAGSYTDGKFHQPLIDVGLFNKVQEVLKARCVSIHYTDNHFSIYRAIARCSCGRAFSAYEQKGIIYYRTRCAPACTNPDKNLKEEGIHTAVQSVFDKIYFNDAELKEIQEKAHIGLDNITVKRNKALDDLYAQQKRVFADLDYITKNKIALLRTNSMSIESLKSDEDKLTAEMNGINQQIAIYGETAQEMLKYVLTFSELVKNASLYYQFALDSEKRELLTEVFTELVFHDGKLVAYKAKDGFDALLKRSVLSGSGDRDRTCDQSLTLVLLLLRGVDYIIPMTLSCVRDEGLRKFQKIALQNFETNYSIKDSLYTFFTSRGSKARLGIARATVRGVHRFLLVIRPKFPLEAAYLQATALPLSYSGIYFRKN